METTVLIGRVAERTQTTIKAIRYYERINLIPPVARSGKYRVYTEKTIERIRFIKTSQALGFSLKEIGEILQAYDSGGTPCKEIDDIVDQKLPLIEQKIKELQLLQQELKSLKSRLPIRRKDRNEIICPAICNETFSGQPES